jgi:hypothetical protein
MYNYIVGQSVYLVDIYVIGRVGYLGFFFFVSKSEIYWVVFPSFDIFTVLS